jgi:hypothetical protein
MTNLVKDENDDVTRFPKDFEEVEELIRSAFEA